MGHLAINETAFLNKIPIGYGLARIDVNYFFTDMTSFGNPKFYKKHYEFGRNMGTYNIKKKLRLSYFYNNSMRLIVKEKHLITDTCLVGLQAEEKYFLKFRRSG